MYITKEKFEEIKAKHNTLLVLEDDVDEALTFVRELLEAEADELEGICEFDDLAYMEDEAEITAKMDEFNDGLMFHKLGMQSGYYSGVQFIVETEYDLSADDYDNDDCRYYFDCCRSAAYRKYAAEIRKINRFMEKLGKAYGFEELVCTGRFSNGEATFAPASNSRARLYAAIA